VVARVGDIYAALPGITGKIELEYEGEMRGADTVVREIIRASVANVFDKYFKDTNTQQIEQWFNLGGTVQLNDAQPSAGSLAELQQIQGLIEKLAPLEINTKTRPEIAVSAAEFLLEGMYAHKRLSRTEERSFTAGEKKSRHEEASRYAEKIRDREMERDDYAKSRTRRGFN
jgi:magnesium chelatase subunit I